MKADAMAHTKRSSLLVSQTRGRKDFSRNGVIVHFSRWWAKALLKIYIKRHYKKSKSRLYGLFCKKVMFWRAHITYFHVITSRILRIHNSPPSTMLPSVSLYRVAVLFVAFCGNGSGQRLWGSERIESEGAKKLIPGPSTIGSLK